MSITDGRHIHSMSNHWRYTLSKLTRMQTEELCALQTRTGDVHLWTAAGRWLRENRWVRGGAWASQPALTGWGEAFFCRPLGRRMDFEHGQQGVFNSHRGQGETRAHSFAADGAFFSKPAPDHPQSAAGRGMGPVTRWDMARRRSCRKGPTHFEAVWTQSPPGCRRRWRPSSPIWKGDVTAFKKVPTRTVNSLRQDRHFRAPFRTGCLDCVRGASG